MAKLKIALLQLLNEPGGPEANLIKGAAFCRKAAAMGADIALFPEMWSIGYVFPDLADPQACTIWEAQAIDQTSPFFLHFQKLAQELNMAIALTYLEKWPGKPRNAVSLIDRYGQLVLTYAKVHTCDFDLEATLTPGDAFRVANLDTMDGEVKIGAMICYDREFPESARVLMLQGAEIILTPNSCPLEQNRLSQYRSRAFENMVGLAMVNYPAPKDNGHSIALDGIAFGRDGTSRDMIIVEASEEENIVIAEFDLDALRDYRSREAFGNAYRKPSRYGLLTSASVSAPFIRPDNQI